MTIAIEVASCVLSLIFGRTSTSSSVPAQPQVQAVESAKTYTFVTDQSTVLQTGGIAGIRRQYSIEGQFQLTVDFDPAGPAGAWFDWVDATLVDGGLPRTHSLGELFNMTGLAGKVVSQTTVEFDGKTADDIKADIHLVLTFSGDLVFLRGEIIPPCCDIFNYSMDAVATAGPAGWAYRYFDDFSSEKAEKDSFTHSTFWPGEAFGPAEPYLYYYGSPDARQLAFMDHKGQPAHLGYCFPVGPGQVVGPIKGNLGIDVGLPANADPALHDGPGNPFAGAGYLLFSVSDDGVAWSVPKALGPGHHDIAMSSVQGTCYIIFIGTRVVIDNLDARLYCPPATIRVPKDFATIQQAIDAASNGDVVEVAPGTYKGNGNWDIDFRGKAITVRSSEGPEKTIIDCGGAASSAAWGKWHRGFYFHQAEKPDSVLCGFTIRGGRVQGSEILAEALKWDLNAANPIGGGIFCEFSSPSIINCVIRDCSAEVGGGIGCVGAAPAIVDCIIENCTAGGLGLAESGGRGGGIGLIRDCDAKISNCVVRNNTAYFNSRGGGIYCRQSSAVVARCDISFNGAKGNIQGGGLYCSGSASRLVVQQSAISHNTANAGAGVFVETSPSNGGAALEPDESEPPADVVGWPRCYIRLTNCTITHNKLSGPQMPPLPGGGIHSVGADIVVKNSIVWYNDGAPVFITGAVSKSPVLYSDIERGYPGQGNISAEPLFAPTDVPDYHLQSVYGRYDPRTGEWIIDTNHSLCIDAGDPKDPVGYEPVPNGGRINMGAYGGTREASKGVAHLVYHVDHVGGNDSNTGLSRAKAFATIRKAIAVARDGDTIMVWQGIYEEEVAFNRKAITVQSAADAAVVMARAGYAFSFFGAESSKSVLRNFVISNCGEGAIFCNSASPSLTNLTIVDNKFGIAAYGGADPNITNCILWNNDKGDLFDCKARYSCIESGFSRTDSGGEGNISQDPLFAEPQKGDYHLQSRFGRYWPEHNVWVIDEKTSPCIDAGDPRIYPAQERMPHGGRINMGAYGGTPYASMSDWPLRGDINRDGLVNMEDFAMLAEHWLESLPWTEKLAPGVGIEPPVDGLVIPAPGSIPEYEALSPQRIDY